MMQQDLIYQTLKSPTFFFGLVVLFVSPSIPLQAADYQIDPDHSRIGFSVKHLISRVEGDFRKYEGTFNFDPKNPAKATGRFTVEADSISTANEKRDAHLKSAEFFDVEKFKTLEFEVTKVDSKGAMKFDLIGNLTIHGVKKPITFKLEYTGTAKDPWGISRVGFSAETTINRKDFGLIWNKTLDKGSLLVGDEVKITLTVEGIEKALAVKSSTVKPEGSSEAAANDVSHKK